MGYVHFISHVVFVLVCWFVLAIVIGCFLMNDDTIDAERATSGGMLLSTIVCLLILTLIYW